MVVSFPLWFKIYLGWMAATLMLSLLNYIGREKYILKLRKLPPEKRSSILKSFTIRIKLYKLLFWTSPIYLIAIPFVIYTYRRESLFHMAVMLLLMYIGILEDFLSKKLLIREITRQT